MSKFTSKDITGVIPAMLTCFDENEEVDEKRIRRLVNYLTGQDIGGLYLTGSTGEGFLMTEQERMQVVQATIEQVQGKIPVIVHVGQ